MDFSSSRDSFSFEFFTRWSYGYKIPSSEQSGVYVLFSTKADCVYVGQSSRSVKRRLQHHEKTKPWWSFGFFMDTTRGGLSRNDLDAFERLLINAFRSGRFGAHVRCINVQKGVASDNASTDQVGRYYRSCIDCLSAFFATNGAACFAQVYQGLVSVPISKQASRSDCLVTSENGLFVGHSGVSPVGAYLADRYEKGDVMPFYYYFGEDVFEKGFVLTDIEGEMVFDVVHAFCDELLYFR